MPAPTPAFRDLERWADTPLGDPEGWSEGLRTVARMCLSYPTPCCVVWGRRAHFFYNEAMAASIGARHPAGMGQPLYDVLPHLWATVGPVVHEVMRTGRAFAAQRFPVQADVGDGALTFFVDFTFVPVFEGDRAVAVFAPVGNNTETHLHTQHLEMLTAIATVPSGQPRDDVAVAVCRFLVGPDDVRFAALFLEDPDTGRPERVATGGGALRSASALAALDVAVAQGRWPIEQTLAAGSPPTRVTPQPVASPVPRPSWEAAWLVALPGPVRGVLAVGLDDRFPTASGPGDLVARLAAAVGERLARD